MRLFNEKVTPIFTNSNINILTVKDYEEVFFDVYEFEVNGKTFVAEKVASHNSNPVVNIPIVIDKDEFKAPFVLERGSFKVEFNKNIKEYVGSTEIDLPAPVVIQEDINLIIEDNTEQEDLVVEEVVFNENTKKLVKNIQEASDREEQLKLYVQDVKVETLNEVNSKIENTENKITDIHELTISDVKKELEKSENDFLYLNEEIDRLTKKGEFFKTSTGSELKEIKSDIVKLKVEKGELEQRILESKNLLEASVKKLTKLNQDKVQENKYYLQTEVDKLQEKTQFYSDKANKNNLKNDREIHTFKESVSKELDKSKEFLSEEIKSIDISLKQNLDSKLEVTNNEIDQFLNLRLEQVDNDLKEELRSKLLESKTLLQEKVDELKKSIPKVIEKELLTEAPIKSDKNFHLEIAKVEKRIVKNFTDEMQAVRKYMEIYGGGGGGASGSIDTGGEIGGSLLPSEDQTFSLGSAEKRWKDLFISGSTIDIGGTRLKIVDGALKIEDSSSNDASMTVQNLSAANLILSGGRDLADIFATSAQAGINTINAGAGLTGGGSATSVTLNAGAGDGINVSADSIAVDNTVLRTTGASAVGLSATSTTNGFVSAGRDLADIFAPTSTVITKSGLSDFGVIDSFTVASQSSGKYAIAVVDSSGGTQFSEISITTDGTTIGVVEYGINSTTPDSFVEYGAIVGSGTVTLTAKGVGASVISNFTFKGNRLNLF